MSRTHQFTISKFARHPDGYLHSRVVVGERRWYFHRRYGSWLAPGQLGTRPVLMELEALLGEELGREVKFALAEKARKFALAECIDQEGPDNGDTHGPRDDREHIGDDRLPGGGDHRDDGHAVRND